MKQRTIISMIIGLLVVGCVGESKSPDEMARQLQSKVPKAPERPTKRVSTPVQDQPQLPFEVYTWRPRDREGYELEIVILGKNLTEAESLTIGKVVVKLTPSEDGRSAVGRYPSEAQKDMPILLKVGEHEVELPERFSPLKLEGLPKIQSCSFSWETVQAPERIPEVGGRSIRAIRFDCRIGSFEARNAPVTAFIGSFVILNTEITEAGNRLTGYVYRVNQLEDGTPLTIDFGHGLRVLAPLLFKRP